MPAGSRTRPVQVAARGPRSATRRRRVRERFDSLVQKEWHRYTGSAWRVLVGELRERFLERHLSKGVGWVLELGPGPGRFTPTVLRSGARVVAVDLSLPMLHSLGRRARTRAGVARLSRVRGAGEHLPFRDGTFRAAVAYGNILGFAGADGEQLVRELARVIRPWGTLLLDVASPVGASTEFLTLSTRRGFLRKLLRNPDYYFLSRILGSQERGHQPYAPARMGYFEFDFYTVHAAEALLADAGFHSVDRMALGVIGAFRERLASVARRDRRGWRTLLDLEERAGRRSGTLETGHGFVVAAVRGRSRPVRRPRE